MTELRAMRGMREMFHPGYLKMHRLKKMHLRAFAMKHPPHPPHPPQTLSSP
jgi:hypothetical protein